MEQTTLISAIASDTLEGLSASPKYLLPRYFYDDIGSRIFQNIMQMPEYYLTECEYEILMTDKDEISSRFRGSNDPFDLVELGSGDGIKSMILIEHLGRLKSNFTYMPVDISSQVTDDLVEDFIKNYPSLNIVPQIGDYFEVLEELKEISTNRKVIMFLGANIGNFSDDETNLFLSKIGAITVTGDRLMIGFDLKKSPEVIMNAYNDPHGYTRDFNLNLLERFNREFGADFNITEFEHHTDYDPISGDVKSYLVSRSAQVVRLPYLDRSFSFKKWEPIFMERSRKFNTENILNLAEKNGFRVEQNFIDNRGYFVDSLWMKC